MKSKSYLLIVTILFAVESETSRILAVFPFPSISHQLVFRPLVIELAKRGHEVFVITTDRAYPKGGAPNNFNEIDVRNISYTIFRRFVQTQQDYINNLKAQIEVVSELIFTIVFEQIQTKEVQDIINNKNGDFDLLILEACIRPALIYSHMFKLPIIQLSSFGGVFGNFESVGAYTHPIFYPIPIGRKLYNLNLREKLSELYKHYTINSVNEKQEETENMKIKEILGPNVPSFSELRKNIHMLFLNVHPTWDSNRPVPPNVIYLGGLHLKPQQNLPTDLKSYLDSSLYGVIYMSFGTNVIPSLLPPEKINIFNKVFGQLPYNVVWKWDKDVLPGQTNNTKIFKWLPQQDLLRHPKIKVFITQGGLQSTDEAINAAVPLIGVPMLGDQWYNAEQYVHHKIGWQLSITTLTEESLKNAIETVIKNKSYKENIIKLRNIFNDQPQTSLERGVWWTEYVLRHKGALHLQAPTANMSWAELYQLDIILTVLSISIILIILIVFTLKLLLGKKNFKLKTQ